MLPPPKVTNLHKVRRLKKLRAKLGELRESSDLSYKQIEANAKKAGAHISSATAHTMVTGKGAIKKEHLSAFLVGCGVTEEHHREWIEAWERTKKSPWTGVFRWKPDWRSRPVAIAIGGTLVVAAAVAVPLRTNGRCGDHEHLKWADRQCVGVAVPGKSADPGVLGPKLEPVLKLIGDQNDIATKDGPGTYATVAFMAPLTTADPDTPLDPRTVPQVRGAYLAQMRANGDPGKRPKIRLVVANQGADEVHWEDAVRPLEKMADPKGTDHLLAVTGLGLSQDETAKAAQWLAKRDIPMVGDIITADHFTKIANSAEAGKGMCLARVSISNTEQLNAIAKRLKPPPATAALVSVSNTSSGTADSYARSLAESFQRSRKQQHLKAASYYPYAPRGGSQALDTIAQQLGKTGLVYFSGRAKNLKDFLRALHNRPERARPITVVTGSDGVLLQRSASPDLYSGQPPILGDPAAPITVVYTPLADPIQLKAHSSQNLYEAFESAYTKARFPISDLDTGWAITAHDAALTAITAIRKAVENVTTPRALPNLFGVCNQLGLLKDTGINGASGYFSIDPTTGDRIDRDVPPEPVTLPRSPLPPASASGD